MSGAYLKLILIGVVGGLIAGGLGTTTATTTMMGLMALNLVPNFATAAGTTLLSILPPLSIFAAYEYYKKGQMNLKYAAVLMIVCTLFEWIGGKYNHLLSDKILKRILAVYLFLVGAYMMHSSFAKKK